MATKKQKRAEAEARHLRYMEELRREGLNALKKDRENRQKKELQAWQDQHDKKHVKKLLKECPHCQIILNAPISAEDLVKAEAGFTTFLKSRNGKDSTSTTAQTPQHTIKESI